LVTVLLLAMVLCAPVAQAKISAEEAARLGQDLTPFGGEKAGNAEGTIPAWEGGITQPPANYKQGDHHPDPFADDKMLFKINKANMAEYADKLTEGHKALLAADENYYLGVYTTRRSASAPQRIYDGTKRCAQTAVLTEDGNGVLKVPPGCRSRFLKTGWRPSGTICCGGVVTISIALLFTLR